VSADGCPAAITSDAPAIVKRVALSIIKPPIGRARYHKICAPSGQLVGLDREARRAKGAVDPDDPVIPHHGLAFIGRESGNHGAHIVGVAAATAAKWDRR